ncbi:HpcH/HpaI aldolase family protein [Natrinema gelatinilyticum]|uniref:HpcH/HpaI aldolase family protein n=1 Tax=Natrinema gelatinilyticum TaxID=2961571 RepID=UPI0020C485EE|nr:aldolase/citrate lyase family protein [Natrinema gelatinilyticum]
MSHSPRGNALRESLEAGEVSLGVLDNTYNPTVVELYATMGLDFVWIDLEHGGPSPWDAGQLEGLLRAVEGTDAELLVRVPDSDPTLVRKALDAGVRNVFLPRVGSAAELRAAVRAGRFEYDGEPGRRGMASPRAGRWGLTDDYVPSEDESVVVGVTVETEDALDDLEAILEVPELGFVFIGPLDLSVSLGHPGEFDHEEVEEAVETIRSAAVEADVPVGGLGFGMNDVNRKAGNGYQLLNIGTTTGALQSSVTGWLDDYDHG